MKSKWIEIGFCGLLLVSCAIYYRWLPSNSSYTPGPEKPAELATVVASQKGGQTASPTSHAKLNIHKIYVGMPLRDLLKVYGRSPESSKSQGWGLFGGYHDGINDEVAVYREDEACAVVVGSPLFSGERKVDLSRSGLTKEFGKPSKVIKGPVTEVWVYDGLRMLVEIGYESDAEARVMLGTTDIKMLSHTFGGLP